MITFYLNGEARQADSPQSLQALLDAQADLPENFAIAINQQFVPRGNYDDKQIIDGDQIELVVPMQGG